MDKANLLNNKSMNCLYIHGYKGSPNHEKIAELQRYYEVTAPFIDYDIDDINKVIKKAINKRNIDIYIGTSMGGYVAYYLSCLANKPCLLFNPAFASTKKDLINFKAKYPKTLKARLTYIVLGKNDELIDHQETLNYIAEQVNGTNLLLRIHTFLGHSVPLDLFKREVMNFKKIEYSFK